MLDASLDEALARFLETHMNRGWSLLQFLLHF
jgi:hypothetical protein